MNWNPISTAPKDGTKILGVREGRLAIIRWDLNSHAKKPVPYWDGSDALLWGVRWAKETQPTHWMNLPPLPTEETQC